MQMVSRLVVTSGKTMQFDGSIWGDGGRDNVEKTLVVTRRQRGRLPVDVGVRKHDRAGIPMLS